MGIVKYCFYVKTSQEGSYDDLIKSGALGGKGFEGFVKNKKLFGFIFGDIPIMPCGDNDFVVTDFSSQTFSIPSIAQRFPDPAITVIMMPSLSMGPQQSHSRF